VSSGAIKRAKRYESAGDLISAARALISLKKSGTVRPEVRSFMKSLCSQMYQLAEESYQRRDLRKRELVRLLLLLDGSPAAGRQSGKPDSVGSEEGGGENRSEEGRSERSSREQGGEDECTEEGVTGRVPEIQITAMKPTRQGAANLSRIVDGVGKRRL